MTSTHRLLLVATLFAAAIPVSAQDPPSGHGHGHAQSGHDQHAHGGHAHGQADPMEGKDMNHDFSDAERWAKVFDDPARVEWQKPQEVVAVMGLKPGMAVADLGAGTGFFLGYLSTAVGPKGKVLALEPEANLIQHMRKRIEKAGWKNTRVKQIPYNDPAVPDNSFDRILIVDTWHHIKNRAAYAAKLAAALKKGGAVYVVDFTLESPVGPKKDHRLAPDIVQDELKAGGLEVAIVEETLPNQYIIRATRP